MQPSLNQVTVEKPVQCDMGKNLGDGCSAVVPNSLFDCSFHRELPPNWPLGHQIGIYWHGITANLTKFSLFFPRKNIPRSKQRVKKKYSLENSCGVIVSMDEPIRQHSRLIEPSHCRNEVIN
jgi:hypothetical protein